MGISRTSVAAFAAAAVILGGCSRPPAERPLAAPADLAPTQAAEDVTSPVADDSARRDPGAQAAPDAERVPQEIRDAKEAAEDATRRIVDLTRGAAAAITEAGRDAVASVRERSSDDTAKP